MPNSPNTGHHRRPSVHAAERPNETGDWTSGTNIGPYPYITPRSEGWACSADDPHAGRLYRRRGRARRWLRAAVTHRAIGITAVAAAVLFAAVCTVVIVQPGPVTAGILLPLFALGTILIVVVTAVTWLSHR